MTKTNKIENLQLLEPKPGQHQVEKHHRNGKSHPRGKGQASERTKVLKKNKKNTKPKNISKKLIGLTPQFFHLVENFRYNEVRRRSSDNTSATCGRSQQVLFSFAKICVQGKITTFQFYLRKKSKNTNICSISNAH